MCLKRSGKIFKKFGNKLAAPLENRLSAYAKTKTQISFAVTAKLLVAFVFATRIVHSLYFPPKFQASSNLLWLNSSVCVEPCRKPRRHVISLRGSNVTGETSFILDR